MCRDINAKDNVQRAEKKNKRLVESVSTLG